MNDWLVIGVGNPWRGDDAVGAEVIEHLEMRGLPATRLRRACGEGTELMQLWRGWQSVLMIDAMRAGGKPGDVVRFDAQAQSLPTVFRYSTHAFGLAEAVETARALQELPPRLSVFGVEGQCFESGQRLSAPVRAAVPLIGDAICQELSRGTDLDSQRA